MPDESAPLALQRQYQARFAGSEAYRASVWKELSAFFSRYVPAGATVLDLGCGWGEFINSIPAATKIGMDLNPAARAHLHPDVLFLHSDCATTWQIADASLDLVFTSNFLEHLPAKGAVEQAVSEAFRCLRPGGTLICMCPNIRYVHGAYWDFWDHHLPLTELSVGELLTLKGFSIKESVPRFLPYSMSRGRRIPLFLVRWYLRVPFLWRILGKQFLVVGVKEAVGGGAA